MIKISQDEAEIYDRQIRLWGVDAQQRIQNASVLIAGVRALSNEICKNLALAGIGSITLLDHRTVSEHDLGAQFFLDTHSLGKNRAEAAAPAIRALNPLVDVKVDHANIAEKPDDFFRHFDIVCLVHADAATAIRVNRAVRDTDNPKPFYAADAFGWFGYIFCDLARHAYVQERESVDKSGEKTTVRTECVEEYVSLSESLEVDWSRTRSNVLKRISRLSFVVHLLLQFQLKHNRPAALSDLELLTKEKPAYLQKMGIQDADMVDNELLSNVVSLLETELVPVAAIVGGVLSQEMIKVLSQKQLPVQNWFYYNGMDDTGVVHCVRNEKASAAAETSQEAIVL